MTATATTTVLGLSAAIIWGAADFSGGIGARYLRVYWLLAISHASSLVALVLLADLLHQPLPRRTHSDVRFDLRPGRRHRVAGVLLCALPGQHGNHRGGDRIADGGASSVIFISNDRRAQPPPGCRIRPGCRSHLADQQSVEFQPAGCRGPAKKAGARGDFRDWFWHFPDRAARSQQRRNFVAAGGIACRQSGAGDCWRTDSESRPIHRGTGSAERLPRRSANAG